MTEALIFTLKIFFLPIGALLIFNAIFDYLVKNSLIGSFYYLIIFPGVVIHEISHAVFAILMGAQITRVKLFSTKGGSVTHTKPKVPVIGQFVISFAPIIGQIIAILLLARFLTPDLFYMSWHSLNISDFSKFISSLDWFSWQVWVLLYLISSCALSIAPSAKDISNSIIGITIISGLIFGISYLNLNIFILDFLKLTVPSLWLATMFLFIALLATLPLFVLNKLLGR